MKPKILIVDDEENIRFGFSMILEDAGYEVAAAGDYDAALSCIAESEPDLIITDIILGGRGGGELLLAVKKRELRCPVVMITGEPNVQTSADAVRLGAFDYVSKPIRSRALLRITAHALQHKKLLDKKYVLEKENLRVRLKMEAIFRSLQDGVLTVRDDMRVIEANDAVGTICGFSAMDMVGERFDRALARCARSCMGVLKQTLETRKPMGDIQVECGHPDKPRQAVHLTGSPLEADAAGAFGAVLVIRDVTRLSNLERELKERRRFHRMIGKSEKMQSIYGLLENIADTDSTVLITGETGTGKELAADAIHHGSGRKDKPFVKVNCSALSENLLESELFGHVRGAFTGAVNNKVGRFEMADGGSLFLDEIGDISPLIQLKLLRVLQEKEFERVGESRPVKTDVRVIAATNRDLGEKVRRGEFREDLYYRIKVVDISIPALRDRREDIPLLTDHFLRFFNGHSGKRLKEMSSEATAAFLNYPWPGNVRELEHAVERGVVLSRGETLLLEDLPGEIRAYVKNGETAAPGKRAVTGEDVRKALDRTDWNKAKAARLLGIGRRTIYRKIEEFNIVK